MALRSTSERSAISRIPHGSSKRFGGSGDFGMYTLAVACVFCIPKIEPAVGVVSPVVSFQSFQSTRSREAR